MDKQFGKRFFGKYVKSSAVLVSLGIHALLLVVALSFVAVTVINKEDQVFEAKPVSRPKMQLKKLQVPVNIKKKKTQKPKLRKRIVVQPKLNQTVPDIKMPEITGVKGGIGSGAGDGLGGGGGLGFSMPEISLFNVKSKSERIFFALDASEHMMVDEIGGVRSYEIIKSEMIRILKELNSTVLFNVAVYSDYSARMLFPKLVPANAENVNRAVAWLEPLNRFTKNKTTQDQYGSGTTGQGGAGIDASNQVEPLKGGVSHWAAPVMEAMKEQADTAFILTSGWGFLAYKTGESSGWSESNEARFRKKVVEAGKKLQEDNAERSAAGDPPRIIPATNYERNLVEAYFPGEPLPPYAQYKSYTPMELVKAFVNVRKKHGSDSSLQPLGLKKRANKNEFVINVIQFCEEGESKNNDFVKLTSLLKGQYRLIEGLEAVESYVPGGSGK